MESFFKTLKYDEVHLSNYETYDDVIERLPHFIEEVYKKKRMYSALVLTPGGIRDGDSETQNYRSRSPQISVKTLQLEAQSNPGALCTSRRWRPSRPAPVQQSDGVLFGGRQ